MCTPELDETVNRLCIGSFRACDHTKLLRVALPKTRKIPKKQRNNNVLQNNRPERERERERERAREGRIAQHSR